MRLVITIILVILATIAGWHYYPQLYKAISGKDAPLKQVEEAAQDENTPDSEKEESAE